MVRDGRFVGDATFPSVGIKLRRVARCPFAPKPPSSKVLLFDESGIVYSGGQYARSMTREEAEALASQLNSEAPDRSTRRRVVRDNGGAWEVVKILVPGELRRGPLGKTVEVEEKPPQPDEPRQPAQRNAPGAWG